MGYFNHAHYVEVTMHFRCNLKCKHCMIEDTMDRLRPESDDEFEKLIQLNAREDLWRGIVFTGSEMTLRDDLPDLARRARSHGFDHVRIQTHGMRLAKRDYCRKLIDAGIDEFFVSITAADAGNHDAITEVPGSFDKALKGLENLDGFEGVVSFTNTVITKRSYRQLPQVVDRLSHLKRLVQMDFWNYWPMRDTDDKDLIVSHKDILPYLIRAVERAQALGRSVEIKNFPECLLGEQREALDNDQPKLVIDPSFWKEFHSNGFHQCVHRDVCGSTKCLGLTTAYARKFGWEEKFLSPLGKPEIPEDVQPKESCKLDGLYSPLETAVSATSERQRSLVDAVADLGVPFTSEKSFRICHGTLDTDRFLLTLNKRYIRNRPNQTVMGVCRALQMPEDLLAGLGKQLAIARFVHFGYERRGDAELYKVYLEFSMPQRVNSDPRLLYVAFKWDCQHSERQVETKYHWFPRLSGEQIQRRITRLYDRPDGHALEQVGSIIRLAEERNPETPFRYLEVTEAGNQRRSFDLNLYDAELRMKDLTNPLAGIARHHQIPEGEFKQLFDTIQREPIGHLAGGMHREGVDFFNVYYGVERHQPNAAIGSSE